MESEIGPKSRFTLGLSELWEFRELFYFFTLRDVKIKYKQTFFGVLWAVLQPVLLCLLFTFLMGKAISSYTELPLPYDVFALSGLVLWGIFGSGLNNAGNSMVNNSAIIRKIYFPRLIIPLSSVLVGLIDFMMAFLVFIVYCLVKSIPLHWQALYYFPGAVLLTCVATFGAGTLLAALNVKFRDFRYVIPFLVQLLLFLTPVIYPVAISDNAPMRWFMALNPMTAPLDFFRAGLLGELTHPVTDACSVASSLVFLVTGLVYFRRTEAYFADLA